MKKRVRFNLFLALTLLLGACQQEELLVKTSDRIFFSTVTYNTKAGSFTPDNANNPAPVLTMGVFATSTGEQNYNPNNHTVNFFDNIKVARTGIGSDWEYSNPAYWPQGNVTFFGYAPYGKASIDISKPGAPIMNFGVENNQENQTDLLVASPVVDKTKTTSAVTMAMHHALTKVGFSARLSHDADEATKINWVKISKIEIEGVYTRGNRSMDIADSKGWYGQSSLKLTGNPFVVSIGKETDGSGGGLNDTKLTNTYTSINETKGYMLMLPQTFIEGASAAKIKVYVAADWTNDVTDDEILTFNDPLEFDLALTGLDWREGEAINYMIHVDISKHAVQNSTLKAELVDWNETEANAVILNRQLNVTRTVAQVNGGAVTRIYFWSNQPDVWIDDTGNQGGIYPDGASYTVNDVFRNLSKSASSGPIYNLHYDSSIQPDAGGGWSGFFDVENKNNIGQANENYHIYLCAANTDYSYSPLRRSIRLNKILQNLPASGNIKTPYVGTFHRNNEVGERIITWNNTGTWTAVIMDINSGRSSENSMDGYPDYQHVLIDREISPAMEAGILYTDAPGNAEDYKVSLWRNDMGGASNLNEPYKGKRWISGTDRVYLRIGWKNQNLSPTRNRYAIIHIYDSAPTASGDVSGLNLKGILYIRQGEEADYIYRPTDLMGEYGTGISRNAAVKWLPYNLSEHHHKSESNYFNYKQIPYQGAETSGYPTMAGIYLRWGDNRAISSLNVDCSLYFNYKNSYIIHDKWEPINMDICPKGYRIPEFKRNSDYHYEFNSSAGYPNQIEGNEVIQSLIASPKMSKVGVLGMDAPYPEDPSSNWLFGYYADGYFDRGLLDKGNNSSSGKELYAKVHYAEEAGYYGALIFNPVSLATIFFPYTGSINEVGISSGEGNFLRMITSTSDYSSSYKIFWLIVSTNDPDGDGRGTKSFYFPNGSAIVSKKDAYTYRCIKDDSTINNNTYCTVFIEGNEVDYWGTGTSPNYYIKTVLSGTEVTLPTANKWWMGYDQCKRWNTRPDGSGTDYAFDAKITLNSDLRLYPKYK